MYSAGRSSLVKNTVYLTFRSLISMLIALYSSRIILEGLGVEDFGIYNLVGSVIAFWSSLRGMLASSTQRFLSVASSSHSTEDAHRIFSSSLLLHLGIGTLFLLLVGGAGSYLIGSKLSIPSGKLLDAYVVFGASLISVVCGVITTPFESVLIAHEEMGVFSMISILDALGKLIIAFFIPYMEERLIFFGVSYASFSILLRYIIVAYSKSHFEEARWCICKDPIYIKKIISFSSWNFLGNSTHYIISEGVNFTLNVFWGPVLNAARGISFQVYSALNSFSGNLITAANPRICHLMANEKQDRLDRISSLTSRASYFSMLVLVLGFYSGLECVLKIWLGNLIPEHTIAILKLVLLYGLVRTLHGPIDSLFLASGDLKVYQITELTIKLTSMGIIVALCSLGGLTPESVFMGLIIMELISFSLIASLAVHKKLLDPIGYLRGVIIPILSVSIISWIVYSLALYCIDVVQPYWVFLRMALIIATLSMVVLLWGYNKEERLLFYQVFSALRQR